MSGSANSGAVTASKSIDYASFLAPFHELEASLRTNFDIMFDSQLPEVVAVALKNAPYVCLDESNTWYEFFASRCRWADTWGHCLWSTVQNVALAVIYSFAVIFTCAQYEATREGAKKFWIQTALAIVSWATSAVGVFSPTLAASCTVSFAGIVWKMVGGGLDDGFQTTPTITAALNKGLREFVNKNKDVIAEKIAAMPAKLPQDLALRGRVHDQFNVFLRAFDADALHTGDMVEAVRAAVNFLPHALHIVMPPVTRAVVD